MVEHIVQREAKVFTVPVSDLVRRLAVPLQLPEIPIPPQAQRADQLFEALLAELLKGHPVAKARQPKHIPTDEPDWETAPDRRKWPPPERGNYQHPSAQYAEASSVDYGRLFSHLGKLKTAQHIYADHYLSDAGDVNRRFHNDAEAFDNRIFDREVLRDRKNLWGAGLIEYNDPLEHERYKLHRMLMGETMKMVRGMLVAS